MGIVLAQEIKSEATNDNMIHNERYYSVLSEKVFEFAQVYKLTKREAELLLLSILGYTNKDIALQCCISEKTVKHHLENIKGKLAVQSSRKLMALFVESLLKSGKGEL